VKKFLESLRQDEGQDIVEYGLLAAFISISAVLVIKILGPLLVPLYQSVKAALTP
jgi:Flp pilus assembly pilin Flp